MRLKYIIFTHRKMGLRLPVLFHDLIKHSTVSIGEDFVATSAGFYDTKNKIVFGESDSMGLKPMEGDEKICEQTLTGDARIYNQNIRENLKLLELLKTVKK